MMDDTVVHHSVEAGVGRGNHRRVSDKYTGATAVLRQAPLCEHNHLRIQVEAGDACRAAREQDFNSDPAPAADFQYLLPG